MNRFGRDEPQPRSSSSPDWCLTPWTKVGQDSGSGSVAEVPTGGQLVWGPGYSHGSVGGQLTLITWQSLKLRTPSKSQRHDFRWGDGLTAQQGPNSHGTRAGCLSDTSSPPLKRLRVSFLIWKAGLWGQAGALPVPRASAISLCTPRCSNRGRRPRPSPLCSSLLEYTLLEARWKPARTASMNCDVLNPSSPTTARPPSSISVLCESPAWDLGCWRGSRRQ